MSDSQPTFVSRTMQVLQHAARGMRLHSVTSAVVLLLCMAAAAPCHAQSAPTTANERVLLLRTGRVVQGRMQRISTGWLVTAKHGRVVVPTDQVRLDADNIEEVYLSLRLRPGPSHPFFCLLHSTL